MDSQLNIRITAQDKASVSINAIGKSLSGLGQQATTIDKAFNAFAAGGLSNVSRSLSTLTSLVSSGAGPWGVLAGAVVAAGSALGGFAIKAANAAEELENMSAITGIAAADLEALQRISEDAGLGTGNLASSIGNLNRQLASGEGGDFARVLGALGGSVRDTSGNIKDAITVLDEIREALLAVEDPAERARLANAAFGRSLRDLIPLILNTQRSMRDQIEAQKESGRVIDEVTRENLLVLDQALDDLKADWDRLTTSILSATGAVIGFFNAQFGGDRTAGATGGWRPSGASGTWGPSPLEQQAEMEARARAIATGKRGEELELAIKIELAEARLAQARDEGQAELQIAIAQEIALYKQRLEVMKETEEARKRELKAIEEIDRKLSQQFGAGIRGELPIPPVPILGPTILTPEQIQEMKQGIATGLENLNVEALQIGKKRIDAEVDYYYDSTSKVFRKIDDQREEAFKEQQRQYERMIDGIREGAGRVFDAMLTKGESVFSSLARFAEGVLQTMLRNIFQNAIVGLAQSSGILRQLLGGGGLTGAPGGGGGGGGVAGGVVAGFAPTIWTKLGVRRGGGGAHLQDIAAGKTAGGFAATTAGGALTAGGLMAGQMLAMDAFRRGSAIEGLAGGAMAGASIGTMIAPGIGTAIGAGVGAIAGLVTGLFGGGAKRRAEEAARRAALQEQQKFGAPGTIDLFGLAGESAFGIEPDLTGRIRGIGRVPTVIVNVDNSMIDASHAKEAGAVIGQEISRQILAGGSYLADNVAWAAGAP